MNPDPIEVLDNLIHIRSAPSQAARVAAWERVKALALFGRRTLEIIRERGLMNCGPWIVRLKDLPTDADFAVGGKFDYEMTGNAGDEQALGAARSELETRKWIEALLADAAEEGGK